MLSFIIPAHDEEAVIASTIRAVRDAAARVDEPYEVIVVDDASTDRTAAIAEAEGVRLVRIAARHIAAARNAGAAVARGELLVFVDADTLVNVAAVRGAVEAFRGGAVGGGAAVRFDEPTPFYARALLPLVLWVYRRLRLASGCFLFCTRVAFESVSGFDEGLFAAEEVEMSRALRKQGRFVMLRGTVVTSGRKLRTYSAWQLFSTLVRLALAGRRELSDRRRLALWYGPRRKDPRAAA